MPPTRTRSRSKADPSQKPRNDVYVGLLIISFLAMVAGTVLLYLDFAQFPEGKPKEPPALPKGALSQPVGGGGAGGAVNPVPPVGGGGGPMPMPMPNNPMNPPMMP
jgi:hypothetical protein